MKRIMLLALVVLQLPLWAFGQSYTKEERVLWLSRMWKDVADNYYDPMKLQRIGWDELYTEYIPLVWNASDDGEYHRLLERFMAEVGDGHTQFRPKVAKRTEKYRLPLYDMLPLEDGYYVTSWVTECFPDVDYPPRIVAVDGIPFEQYIDEKYVPYVTGNTLHYRRLNALTYFLVGEEKDRTITVSLMDKDGNVTDHEVSYYIKLSESYNYDYFATGYPVNNSSGHYGYTCKDKNGNDCFWLHFNRFWNIPSITKDLEKWSPEMIEADYFVIDLRLNTGGDETIADTLLMSFLDVDTMRTYKSQHRIHNGVRAAHGYMNFVPEDAPFYNNTAVGIAPEEEFVKTGTGLPTFPQPLYILTGTRTLSAAEDFIIPLLVNYPDRAVTFGTPTGGSTGAPLVREMPDGSYYRVCTRGAIVSEDFNERGIIPDVYSEWTIDDLIEGRDSLLDVVADYYRDNDPPQAHETE